MPKRLFSLTHLLSWVLMTILIAGCGFKLRGQLDIPETSKQVQLVLQKGTPDVFERTLKADLSANGIALAAPAPYILKINQVSENRRSITLDSRANTDEYALNFFVDFEILNAEQQSLSGELKARVQRIYDYNSDAATASQNLEQTIRQEMWSTLSQSVLRQYIATIRRTDSSKANGSSN